MPTPRLHPLSVFGLAALMCSSPGALEAQRAVFKTAVDMVPLTVTVTDGSGKFINQLAERDFAVFEDGIEQPVSFFANENVAVDLALVLDVSGSMQANLPTVKRAARGLVRQLGARDRATVVAIKNVIGISQSLTSDRALIESAIQELTASGDTALYDGLYVVLKELARTRLSASEIRKQTVVVLSDGLDTTSRLRFEDVQDLAGRVGVNIYVIALPSSGPPAVRTPRDGHLLQADYAMRSLARDSGGRWFSPRTLHELPDIYAEIGAELSHQYELGYLPLRPLSERGFRRVSVRVENAVTRTRSGYYADSSAARATMAMPFGVPATEEPRPR